MNETQTTETDKKERMHCGKLEDKRTGPLV